ncbi:MAG: alpha/beta hydrolase [Bacillota bacterium]|nr:alpha/beta hydrolase [Bacillota bacterium]
MIIDFTYPKENIDYVEGYILKGAFYRCNYIRFKTLYRNPAPGTEIVQLYCFEPKSKVRASVVILHGLGSSNIKFLLWMGTHLASAGINSTVIVLPGNYTRVDHKSVSGRNYLWPDIKIMYQFWEHAVIDVLSTIDLLNKRGLWLKNNCVMGYCLGGMIAAIVTCLDNRINETIFMTTGGHLPKILHESPVTGFARKLFKSGLKCDYFLNDKEMLYKAYKNQFPLAKKMSLLEILRTEKIHPLFKIDPLAYAHLLDKSKVTFIDALLDTTLPLTSRTMLYKEMQGAARYILPMTHVSWLPFERFLAQYILFKVNINDKKSYKQVLKKQHLDSFFKNIFK